MRDVSKMSLGWALLVAVPVCVVAIGCGETHDGVSSSLGAAGGRASRTASSVSPARGYHRGEADGDADSDDNDYYDEDDNSIVYFGRPARPAEQNGIAAPVRAYYAAMVTGNGARLCSLLTPAVAANVPAHYGGESAPPTLRGNTCTTVMSKVFKPAPSRVAGSAPKLVVRRVRVEGDRGLVLFDLGNMLNRNVPVQRERGVWRIDAIGDVGLP